MKSIVIFLVIIFLAILFGAVAYQLVSAGKGIVEKRNQQIREEVQSLVQEKRGAVCAVVLNGPDEIYRSRMIRMKVTAYCLCKICCGKWADQDVWKTSTGDNAKIYDGVAADPKLLPYRTRLKIPGIGIKEVDDTGGAMRQDSKQGIYHIDVRMESHAQSRKWGVQWLDVKVLGP